MIISKTSADFIQVVLKDGSGGAEALGVANKVAQTLRDGRSSNSACKSWKIRNELVVPSGSSRSHSLT